MLHRFRLYSVHNFIRVSLYKGLKQSRYDYYNKKCEGGGNDSAQFAFNLTEFLETAFSKPFIAGELPGSKAGLKPVVNTCENRESRWVISLSVSLSLFFIHSPWFWWKIRDASYKYISISRYLKLIFVKEFYHNICFTRKKFWDNFKIRNLLLFYPESNTNTFFSMNESNMHIENNRE